MPSDRNEESPHWPGKALADIAEKLTNIAEQLRDATENRADRTHAAGTDLIARERLLWLAQTIYDQRRRRCVIIGGPDLFGEPAWDIMLDLYIAHAQGKRVSVSSACIGSASPPTTGLRWLGILQAERLILRENDPQDNRRVNVRLSDDGVERMERYLREIRT